MHNYIVTNHRIVLTNRWIVHCKPQGYIPKTDSFRPANHWFSAYYINIDRKLGNVVINHLV